jgi:DNA-binding transcriptional MerR regulator
MTRRRQETIHISISTAVQRTGLSVQVVEKCVERKLVSDRLTSADLAELRRIRRLQELGVNMSGIEIILHMRRRLRALQAELARWEPRQSRSGLGDPADLAGSRSSATWQRHLPWEPDSE